MKCSKEILFCRLVIWLFRTNQINHCMVSLTVGVIKYYVYFTGSYINGDY